MIPVVAGGLRETSLVPEDLPPLTKHTSQKDNILSFLGRMIPVVARGLRETSLVPEDLPPLTKHT